MAKRASTRCKVLARCIPITDGFSRVRSRRLWGQICPFDISRQDYFYLLCRLLEEYDRAHVRWPKAGVQARLRHLLDESGMSAAEFSRLLGGSRNLGAMILRGDRNLTVAHIRKLSAHFRVSPELLI